jgi:diguanylate cyclase (GGDEF)-like protein
LGPCIGVIAEDFDGPFHSPLIATLHREVQLLGGRLVFVQGTPHDVFTTRLATAIVDGWLVINVPSGAQQLQQLGKPVVLISGSDGTVPSVWPDNRQGVTHVMQHLLSQGHTRIAFAGFMENPDFRERYDVYREVLTAHNVPVDPSLVVDTEGYIIQVCYKAVTQLLERGTGFTALFAANDWVAIAAVQALREGGLRIPADVAVVGFDDVLAAQYHQPPLSSVRQRPDTQARIALRLLLEQLGGCGSPPTVTRLPVQFIARDSSLIAAPATAPKGGCDRFKQDNWREQLSQELVRHVIFPETLEPHVTPAMLWPSVGQLITALDALLQGTTPEPLPADVWQEGCLLAGDASGLQAVVGLLRECASSRLLGEKASLESLVSWLTGVQHAISGFTVGFLSEQLEQQRLAAIRENALLAHLSEPNVSPRQLDWVEVTWSDWAALGLWPKEETGQITVTGTYRRGHGAHQLTQSVSPEVFPPAELLPPFYGAASEHILKLTLLHTTTRKWGYLATLERLNNTGFDTIRQRNGFIATLLEREEQAERLTAHSQHLHTQSTRDPLTNLHNRRYLFEWLPQQLHVAERYDQSLCVMLLDLDNFKQINDHFLHHVGDEVLVAFAGILLLQARQSDLVARYGGEEFVVVLLENGADGVRRFYERLRQAVMAYPWQDVHSELCVTFSAGAASYEAGSSMDTMLRTADQRLYLAKRTGKDRLCTSDEALLQD